MTWYLQRHKHPSYRIYRAWYMQYYTAQLRGIKFDFTFEEWCQWWERHLGPNWFNLRGRNKGQYQMARFGDTGPYAEWNVECITVTKNCSDRRLNGTGPSGEHNRGAKLTAKDVKAIRLDPRSCVEIGVTYGVTRTTVNMIRMRKTWAHIT